MNENNTPREPGTEPTSGHQVPSSFASARPGQIPGRSQEVPDVHTQPTEPLWGTTTPLTPFATTPEAAGHEKAPTAIKDKKSFGSGKVAAVVLAAALVGGISGVGGAWLFTSRAEEPAAVTADGPETLVVNNPGSVNETTAIAASVLPSVVTIDVTGSNEGGSGSGIVLSDDGYILTNTHVVTLGGAAADPTIRVTTSGGDIYNATVVGTDPIYDLAVIKLEGAKDLTPIEFADSSTLNVGSTAVAVGAPLGLSNSVTTGIVSALNRSIQIASSALPDDASQDDAENGEGDGESGGPFQFDIPGLQQQQQSSGESISIAVIQTDAAINPGNSGGALVDSEGKLIGVNVAIATAGQSEESGSIGLGFAIPSNIAKRVANEIIDDGSATHGLFGASVQDATLHEDISVAGAYIVEAVADGAAEDAGLQKGDVVTEFNGVPITNATDLTAQVRAAAAGSTAKFVYVRDGKEQEAEVTLGELSL